MKKWTIVLAAVMLVGGLWAQCGHAAEMREDAEPNSITYDPEEDLEQYLDLAAIESGLAELSPSEPYSFSGTVRSLLSGEIPFEPSEILSRISDLFLSEIGRQRQLAVRILIVVVSSAVFANFVRVFENSQIADISFYMMYLLVSVMLLNAFSGMNAIVSGACGAVSRFMKLLLPSYLATVVISSGTVTALGFYEITVLAMNLVQMLLVRLILPAINFYLILLILNQAAKEDYFSKFAQLIEMVTKWAVKTMLGMVIGLHAVQCLIAPAVDSLKNSAVSRLAKAIPGIGSVLDAAAETVAGSALVIKNAVGAAGILALVSICLVPLVKLASIILIFRLLCALIQPVGDRRMVEGIESISKGAELLLRVLAAAMSVFVISLAMITAAVRGG